MLATAATLALAVFATPASAAPGDLLFRGCFANTNADGCSVPAQAALGGVESAAVSPDGRSVYVISDTDSSISSFDRAADGTLTFQSCLSDTGAGGCAIPPGALAGPSDVAISPDGTTVYVTARTDGAITWFRRATDGSLTFEGCFAETNADGCTVPLTGPILGGARAVTVSPDGTSVYVVSSGDNSLTHFTRIASGELDFHSCFTDASTVGCSVPSPAALAFPADVAVSPDDASVYVVSTGDNAISHFTRAAGGALTFQACLGDASPCVVPSPAKLSQPMAVAVSPGGGSVYVSSPDEDAISHFTRAPDGVLTMQSCFADVAGDGCSVPTQAALDGATGLAISPDGGSVYVASYRDDSISNFTRASDGALTFQNCLSDRAVTGCAIPFRSALDTVIQVAISFDSASVYAAALDDNAITHFSRELAPPVVVPPTEEPPPSSTPDTTAPETAKGKGPKKKVKTKKKKVKVSFEFSSTEAGAAYECNLDAAAPAACTSPARAKVKAKPKAKKHTFEVAAVDAVGNADQTPIVFTFKVQRKP